MTQQPYDHSVTPWTVGQLRTALEGLPEDLPVLVDVAEEPGGDGVVEQVIVDVGFGHGVDLEGQEYVGRDLRIGCEFPSGTYYRSPP